MLVFLKPAISYRMIRGKEIAERLVEFYSQESEPKVGFEIMQISFSKRNYNLEKLV
jgi:hypothetical protein